MEIIVLGVLELNSIAMGLKTLDGMVKAAPIQIIDAKTICPGKFVIIVTGEVAAVDAALSRGKEIGGGYIVDELFIPNLHPQVIPAIIGTVECEIWDAVAVIESFSVVASISAADIAAKTANILVNEVRLATGMGGKSYMKLIGNIYEVEAAVGAAVEMIAGR
ncbi:MAG: BMC domain-containing protein, partial [Candidatus Atribacteria bacterium]|nr:BMC domain-containing protein [Candidatus Atribacteria bacterium]